MLGFVKDFPWLGVLLWIDVRACVLHRYVNVLFARFGFIHSHSRAVTSPSGSNALLHYGTPVYRYRLVWGVCDHHPKIRR